jgi:hypothetical protein
VQYQDVVGTQLPRLVSNVRLNDSITAIATPNSSNVSLFDEDDQPWFEAYTKAEQQAIIESTSDSSTSSSSSSNSNNNNTTYEEQESDDDESDESPLVSPLVSPLSSPPLLDASLIIADSTPANSDTAKEKSRILQAVVRKERRTSMRREPRSSVQSFRTRLLVHQTGSLDRHDQDTQQHQHQHQHQQQQQQTDGEAAASTAMLLRNALPIITRTTSFGKSTSITTTLASADDDAMIGSDTDANSSSSSSSLRSRSVTASTATSTHLNNTLALEALQSAFWSFPDKQKGVGTNKRTLSDATSTSIERTRMKLEAEEVQRRAGWKASVPYSSPNARRPSQRNAARSSFQSAPHSAVAIVGHIASNTEGVSEQDETHRSSVPQWNVDALQPRLLPVSCGMSEIHIKLRKAFECEGETDLTWEHMTRATTFLKLVRVKHGTANRKCCVVGADV